MPHSFLLNSPPLFNFNQLVILGSLKLRGKYHLFLKVSSVLSAQVREEENPEENPEVDCLGQGVYLRKEVQHIS